MGCRIRPYNCWGFLTFLSPIGYYLSSITCGFSPTKLLHFSQLFIRFLAFFIFAISLVFIPDDLSIMQSIYIAIGFACFIFLVWLIIFIINKLTLYQDAETSSIDSLTDEEIPEEISPGLWWLRDEFEFTENNSDEIAAQLIEMGYDPDEVFHFVSTLVHLDLKPTKQSDMPSKITHIRDNINNIFPHSNLLVYGIISTILTFLMTFTFTRTIHFYQRISNAAVYFAKIFAGLSLINN